MTGLLTIGQEYEVVETMSLPELITLGIIIRHDGERPYGRTWTEDRLFEKGCIRRLEYCYGQNGKPWHTHVPTALGRAVYGLARQQYRERKKQKQQRARIGLNGYGRDA